MRIIPIIASVGVILLLLAAPIAAETSQAGGDFTFRRVAVPESGSSKRITVQIDPSEEIYRITPGSDPRRPGDPPLAAATRLPPGLAADGSSDFDWYWQAVSPAIGVDGSERFQAALTAVQRGAIKVGTPRLQTLKAIAERHGVDILTSTIGTNVSPALVLAVISVESAGRVDAISHAGATGLMQLMPATAARFGVSDMKNARENIRGGVAYLDWLLKEFDRDPVLALAGYNSGEGAVAKHGGVPPFAETRAYVPKVLAAWSVARGLCMTPPVLVTDGCVFIGPTIASSGG